MDVSIQSENHYWKTTRGRGEDHPIRKLLLGKNATEGVKEISIQSENYYWKNTIGREAIQSRSCIEVFPGHPHASAKHWSLWTWYLGSQSGENPQHQHPLTQMQALVRPRVAECQCIRLKSKNLPVYSLGSLRSPNSYHWNNSQVPFRSTEVEITVK